MFRFDYDAGRSVFEYLTCELRVSKLFPARFKTTTLGTGTFVVVLRQKPPQRCLSPMWWLEDEVVVVGGGYVALGGGAEGGEGVARERHGPAQAAARGN